LHIWRKERCRKMNVTVVSSFGKSAVSP